MKQIVLVTALTSVCLLGFGAAQTQTPPAPNAQAQNAATGVVFHDRNENLKRDQGEPGLEGVSVSNGLEVVQTDAQGRYRGSVNLIRLG